jgi:hypothetical protein
MTGSDRDDAAAAQLKKVQRAEDGKRAMAEYEAEANAERAKMARLKALRLARDAAAGGPPAKVKKSAKKKSDAAEKREAGSLSDWLKDRENSGRRS